MTYQFDQIGRAKRWRQASFLVFRLTQRDLKNRYAGSFFGVFWAVIQPLMMMLILWFVFTYGLKAHDASGDVPFVSWFFAANTAWIFLADGVNAATNAILEYTFLVKKIRFQVRLLTIIKLLSATFLHFVFLALLSLVLLANGHRPTLYWLQVFYYLPGAFLLLLGVTWVSASLQVFSRDVGQLISIGLQFTFWMTPIIWNWRSLPAAWQKWLCLNPVFYLTEGYRNSFVYGHSIADQGLLAGACFWSVTLTLLLLGHLVFTRLRPHFGDVL